MMEDTDESIHITERPPYLTLKQLENEDVSTKTQDNPRQVKSNQAWMKLRTTIQVSNAIQAKPKGMLKREDSFIKRFSTRQVPQVQEDKLDNDTRNSIGTTSNAFKNTMWNDNKSAIIIVNPDRNFYFYWLLIVSFCVLYYLWSLIVRQSFLQLQQSFSTVWSVMDCLADFVFFADVAVQLRTGYLEQGLMVYDNRKLALHYINTSDFWMDVAALTPLHLLQLKFGTNPLLRFPRFIKVYRTVHCYYMVESRTIYPNFWRVVNLVHILLILAHWFGCFYYLLSESEGFHGNWVYPYYTGGPEYSSLTRKYLGSLYWSTLTLTTIGDLPTPETNADKSSNMSFALRASARSKKSRLLHQLANNCNFRFVFTIVSYLIGVFIFATIVGQVGNVITNRNANRLEFERLLDGAKTYMRHHKVPSDMKRRVLRWYDYSWSRGRIQGGGDINMALGLLPDKLKTELALHVNLAVLKKVTIFKECQPEFLHDVVLKMKAYIFTPGDLICRKGEVAREMFIIADGILQVISGTGHVLTTMMAGDFFGEIGILNLDGYNKRTADVRSVGYSELFSLSRDDVLTAMQDYPEAQEILQTLGRKRLLEVNEINQNAEGDKKNIENHVDECLDTPASSPSPSPSSINCHKLVNRKRDLHNMKGVKYVFKRIHRRSKTEERMTRMEFDGGNEEDISPTRSNVVISNIPQHRKSKVVVAVPTTNMEKEGVPLVERFKRFAQPISLQKFSHSSSKSELLSHWISLKKATVRNNCINDANQVSSTRTCQMQLQRKKYESIHDLSPEYKGLPFVKKLKILNQRQRLCELESLLDKVYSKSGNELLELTSNNVNDVFSDDNIMNNNYEIFTINGEHKKQKMQQGQFGNTRYCTNYYYSQNIQQHNNNSDNNDEQRANIVANNSDLECYVQQIEKQISLQNTIIDTLRNRIRKLLINHTASSNIQS